MGPLRLVSFDLDDTLVDTDAAAPVRVDAALRAAAAASPGGLDGGVAARARAAALAADSVSEGTLRVLVREAALDGEAAEAARAAFNDALLPVLRVLDGVPTVLEALRPHVRLAITTNGPAAMQRAKIDRFGLAERVDIVAISGELGFGKPERAIFDHVRAAAGVDAPGALHVGDSLVTDVGGAQAAGWRTAWLRPRGRRIVPPEPPVPDAVIERVLDVVRLITVA